MSNEIASIRSDLLVFVGLLALLGATVGASFIELGIWALPIGMGIACAKAFLVAAFFMHLRQSTSLVRLVACAGVFWLGILLMLAMSDVLTRT
jgi:cytochrome c oxidase subunit 4